MLRMIWLQLYRRAGRSLALLAGVLVATTGFTVLTGVTATSRLQVAGTVSANSRSTYDILVRPQDSRATHEVGAGLVRPNYLSGQFGGISMDEYRRIAEITGVEVAAPIAMLGVSATEVLATFDLTGAVDSTAARQLIRLDPTFSADNGLSRATGEPVYVYVTRSPLLRPLPASPEHPDTVRYPDGTSFSADKSPCGKELTSPVFEIIDGRKLPLCNMVDGPTRAGGSDAAWGGFFLARLLPDGRFEDGTPGGAGTATLSVFVRQVLPFLVAAIEPDAEAALTGLDTALVRGRYLSSSDRPAPVGRWGNLAYPVLATNRPYTNSVVTATYGRVVVDADALPGPATAGLPDRLRRAQVVAPGPARGVRLDSSWAQALERMTGGGGADLSSLVQPGPPAYAGAPDGALRVLPAPGGAVADGAVPFALTPWQARDVPYRAVRPLSTNPGSGQPPTTRVVGVFDPERLAGFSDLSRVPLETYQAPVANGADAATRRLLGGAPLLPNANPAGYLSAPPLLLTNLSSMQDLLDQEGPRLGPRPLSAVRVRVAGVSGYSAESRERVRVVAQEIARRTGLEVDITYGSSPAPQAVTLPAGSLGRPELHLTERWSRKGVAAVIIHAVDRKSLVLFLLVLVVCALFLANAVSAAVRDRGPQLAVLACLGWPPGRLRALILGEVGTLGLAAGLASVALAVPLGAAAGTPVSAGQAGMAVPVALALALVAGLGPAIRAGRAHPAGALHPPVRRTRHAGRVTTVAAMARSGLTRVPGRTALGVLALAVGVAGLTLLAAVAWVFHGTVVGSLLGDAVSIQARAADRAAVAACVLLGVFAVADVLYLNIRERAAEFAVLRATGWTPGALRRLVCYEAAGIGLAGGILGAGTGLAGAAALTGTPPPRLLLLAAAAATAGPVLAVISAVIPAALLDRLPTTALLAED